MTKNDHNQVEVFVNKERYSFELREQTGRTIKERAAIPLDHVLWMGHHPTPADCGGNAVQSSEDFIIGNDQVVILENGQHFWSRATAAQGVVITINRKEYEFSDPDQTGRALKDRAGIPLSDVLFLQRPGEDEVIANDTTVTLKCGDCFHSAPPANYGGATLDPLSVGFDDFEVLQQPGDWRFLIVNGYVLPECFSPNIVRLLVKLPPLFPDAAPDMFWLSPQVRTRAGCSPQGTTIEQLLGGQWQRFSWHLLPGAWRPGTSNLRDYMRCIRGRLEKRN